MRVRAIDVMKALVLLAAMTGAGCVASWGVGDSPASMESSQGNLAAGGSGVQSRITPSMARKKADDDCAAAQAVVRGSTRYVYQGTGQPLREDSSTTTNLGGSAPGELAPGQRAPTPEAPGQAGQSKPGC